MKAPRKRPFILALAALLIAGLGFGRILGFRGQASRLPPIHDIQTDWSAPIMPTETLLAVREETDASNMIEAAPVLPDAVENRWPGLSGKLISEVQEAAEFVPGEQDSPKDAPYPKLDTFVSPVPAAQAYQAILAVVEDRGWDIVTADARAGRIEATQTSFWFEFKDDVMIRIAEGEGGTRIDVRSVSRVGLSDLGANARRVRNLLDDIEIALHTP